jgi:hypothetical protein
LNGEADVPSPPPPAAGSTYHTRSKRVSVTVPTALAGAGVPSSVTA